MESLKTVTRLGTLTDTSIIKNVSLQNIKYRLFPFNLFYIIFWYVEKLTHWNMILSTDS